MSENLREQVRSHYAELARAAQGVAGTGSCCQAGEWTGGGYHPEELALLPPAAVAASLGCGNPVALADLQPGQVVLDLGSGGGIDVLLSARRVAPGGKAYGLDMTDEMLALARENQRQAGVANAEFLKGHIEAIPLPDGHVDVVISNCVINLSTDKDRVLSEALRVLRPGGRLAISDVVFLGPRSRLPADLLRQVELWTGCVAGALEVSEYEEKLRRAGFEEVAVEVTHTYDPAALAGDGCCGGDLQALGQVPVASAFIRALKPGGGERR